MSNSLAAFSVVFTYTPHHFIKTFCREMPQGKKLTNHFHVGGRFTSGEVDRAAAVTLKINEKAHSVRDFFRDFLKVCK